MLGADVGVDEFVPAVSGGQPFAKFKEEFFKSVGRFLLKLPLILA